MTCHNRVETTLACLKRLFEQSVCDQVNMVVFLVDDGSTDGTGDAIRNLYPGVNVIEGDGNLFWNRGMHRAFEEALKDKFDYYFWLNDDTSLYRDALETMLAAYERLESGIRDRSIIVGSTWDARTKKQTYGGFRSKKGAVNPISFGLVEPGNDLISCDAMCGNCVLIAKGVAEIVGNIDSRYRHRWGDVDYAMRARKNGCKLWVAPGYLAECSANTQDFEWKQPGLSLKQRLAALNSVKGLDRADWFRFVRQHGGVLWPLVWIRPYLRLIIFAFK